MSKWLPPGRGGYRPKSNGVRNPKPPKGGAGTPLAVGCSDCRSDSSRRAAR